MSTVKAAKALETASEAQVSHQEQSQITINSIVRLGPWHGRIVDILTSTATGERYGRVKLVKHLPGVSEVHPLSAFKAASLADVEWELETMQARYQQAWQEVLCENPN